MGSVESFDEIQHRTLIFGRKKRGRRDERGAMFIIEQAAGGGALSGRRTYRLEMTCWMCDLRGEPISMEGGHGAARPIRRA
jgi:hypothetical protein